MEGGPNRPEAKPPSSSAFRDSSHKPPDHPRAAQVHAAFCELTGVRKIDGLAIPTALDLSRPRSPARDTGGRGPAASASAARRRFMCHRLALYFGYPGARRRGGARRARGPGLASTSSCCPRTPRAAAISGWRSAPRSIPHGDRAARAGAAHSRRHADVTVGILALAAPARCSEHRHATPAQDPSPRKRSLPSRSRARASTWRATASLRPAARAGRPARATAGRLIGRERELELLAGLWQRRRKARARGPVSGEAGRARPTWCALCGRRSGQGARLFAYGSAYAGSSPLHPWSTCCGG